MKKYYFILALMLAPLLLFAQDTSKNNKPTAAEIASDAYLNSLVKQKVKNASGNDKQNWSGFGNAALNLLGTNGSSDLTFGATLFTISHFCRIAKGDTNFIDSEYRRQWFARNTQINLGLTPNSKNQVHFDGASLGLKVAMINNKNATVEDYKKLSNILEIDDKVHVFLMKYDDKYHETIQTFLNHRSKDLIASLPQEVIDGLKANFKGYKPETLLLLADSMKSKLTENLAKKPTLTFSANDKYDFVKSQEGSLNLSSDFTIYIGKYPFDFTATYLWSVDTTKTKSALVRKVFTGSIGPNFKFGKIFEVKPAFDYVHTDGPLYKNEHIDKFDASITPRLKINSQFWLPVTIKYDVVHPQFLGFISVQYSLK